MILDYNVAVRTVADGITLLADFDQMPDVIGKLIRLGFFESRPQCVIIVRRFLAGLAPFASII